MLARLRLCASFQSIGSWLVCSLELEVCNQSVIAHVKTCVKQRTGRSHIPPLRKFNILLDADADFCVVANSVLSFAQPFVGSASCPIDMPQSRSASARLRYP